MINQNFCYILIIPGFGIISTVMAAGSGKNVFGYTSSSLIKLILLTQQTICRKVSFFLEILLSTPMLWKFIVSLVKILVIYDNPQITKARSEYFKPGIKEFTGLCMLVGISEAIRLWSILLYTLNYLFMLIKNFGFCIFIKYFLILLSSTRKLTTEALKYVSFYTTASPLKEDGFVKIEKPDNHEISEEYENSNYSYQSFDNQEENNENVKFFEWLAGIIDGDGCFLVSKKGYCSLEIVTQLRDKKILYLIKQQFGGSVKLVSGNNYLRYRLHHKEGLLNLINKINGLMRNPIRILQLGRICEIYGIELKDPKPLTYHSGWLAGFFDTDGSIYFNEVSGQLFITAVQKNRYILEALVELYGGTINPMIKQEAFKWTCSKKKEVLSLVNDYFKVNPCRSEKIRRITMVNDFYKLRNLHAHSASDNSDLGKAWKYYTIKWNSFIDK